MPAPAGSATSPSGSVTAVARRTETPGSGVGVRPSPARRAISSFRRPSSCMPPVNHAGPTGNATTGRIVQEPGSIDLGAGGRALVSWSHGQANDDDTRRRSAGGAYRLRRGAGEPARPVGGLTLPG